MTRDEIKTKVLEIFLERFEIEDPALDVNLREAYQFDSIDALDLLASVEDYLDHQLSQSEKRKAMEIRTLDNVIDYVAELAGVPA